MCEQGSRYLSWDIIPSCVTLNHFWRFEILEHNFYFVCYANVLVFYDFGLDSCGITSESVF